jgi:hypothetical protein
MSPQWVLDPAFEANTARQRRALWRRIEESFSSEQVRMVLGTAQDRGTRAGPLLSDADVATALLSFNSPDILDRLWVDPNCEAFRPPMLALLRERLHKGRPASIDPNTFAHLSRAAAVCDIGTAHGLVARLHTLATTRTPSTYGPSLEVLLRSPHATRREFEAGAAASDLRLRAFTAANRGAPMRLRYEVLMALTADEGRRFWQMPSEREAVLAEPALMQAFAQVLPALAADPDSGLSIGAECDAMVATLAASVRPDQFGPMLVNLCRTSPGHAVMALERGTARQLCAVASDHWAALCQSSRQDVRTSALLGMAEAARTPETTAPEPLESGRPTRR